MLKKPDAMDTKKLNILDWFLSCNLIKLLKWQKVFVLNLENKNIHVRLPKFVSIFYPNFTDSH